LITWNYNKANPFIQLVGCWSFISSEVNLLLLLKHKFLDFNKSLIL
jgi:hypothetical protein